MEEQFDLVIIGAGPGGNMAAIKAASCNMKVALIEKDNVGGTCLNKGCIPTKALIHVARLLNEMNSSEKLGIYPGKISYNINKVHERKNEIVSSSRANLEDYIKRRKVTLIKGKAKILSKNKVEIECCDGVYKEINTEKILIATGSKPIVPNIPGIDLPNVITSDELLSLNDQVPDKLVIIGGGVIGVEFASIYNALGSSVTIIEAANRILSGLDVDISRNLSMLLKKRGVNINTECRVLKIEKEKSELTVVYDTKAGETGNKATCVLVAIGRGANTEGLFGANFSLNMEKGYIVVDNDFKTSSDDVYAVGDVVYGSTQLAHFASSAGANAALKMNNRQTQFNLNYVPTCIYTEPEIACVGLTKEEAVSKGFDVKVAKYSMNSNAKSIISMQDRGFIKLVLDEKNNKVLGAQMMCANATDMINEVTTALCQKLDLSEFAKTIRPHPTFGEAVSEAIEVAMM